jgi:hypothetical protein
MEYQRRLCQIEVLGLHQNFGRSFMNRWTPNSTLAYHPQIDAQMERTNQILEDMLRARALKYGRSWDKSLPYAEFSYKNSYQASIEMAPFKTLYE